MTQTSIPHIEELAEQIAARHGAFLTEVVMRGELRSKVLEVYVDTDDGITIDTCTEISRELSEILDEQELISGAYRLDVSSPDLSRPIKVPRQYKKNIGRTVSVTYKDSDGEQTTEGTLECADDEQLAVRGDKANVLQIPIVAIQTAFVVPQMKKRK